MQPYYRIVVADSRTKRDGRVDRGRSAKYHPKNDPSVIEVDSDRAAYWLGVGAQPTEPVTAIFKVTGDWQKFKGLPAPEPMKVAPEKPDKQALFNSALAEVSGEPSDTKGAATTPKKRAAKKAAAEPAEETPAAAEEAAAPAKPAATTEATAPAAEATAPDAEATAPAAEATAPDAEATAPAAEATAPDAAAPAADESGS